MPGMTANYSHGGPGVGSEAAKEGHAARSTCPMSNDRIAMAAGSAYNFSGEPPGTRTQGPRLKSVKEVFLAAA